MITDNEPSREVEFTENNDEVNELEKTLTNEQENNEIELEIVNNNEIVEEKPKVKSQKKSIYPTNNHDILYVGRENVRKWRLNENFYLPYITLNEYELRLDAFQEKAFEVSANTDVTLIKTARIKELFVFFDKVTRNNKLLLQVKYGFGQDKIHYNSLSIQKNNGTYKLVTGKNERAEALAVMRTGMQKHGFLENEYGLTTISPLIDEYIELVSGKYGSDGLSTTTKKNKNELKAEIETVQRSIISVLRGFYPKGAWKQEARAWGFQREKY